MGSFDHATDTFDHRRTQWGLIVDATYFFGGLRSADGGLFSAIRRIATAGETSGLVVCDVPPGSRDLRIRQDVGASSFVGRAKQEIDNDRARFLGGKAYPHGARGFEIAVRNDGFGWRDCDHLALEARWLGRGLQWYTPWPSGGVLYTSRLWHARGTILGQEVEGMGGVDQVYAPPGYAWGHETVSNELELLWYTWGNRYDDGTIESGHVTFGHGQWGFAIINCGDDEVRTTAVSGRVVERDEERWPLRIEFDVDGVAWEWEADPHGRMPDFGSAAERINTQSDGQFRRVGETRRIEAWWAWGETAPVHGDRRGPAPQLS